MSAGNKIPHLNPAERLEAKRQAEEKAQADAISRRFAAKKAEDKSTDDGATTTRSPRLGWHILRLVVFKMAHQPELTSKKLFQLLLLLCGLLTQPAIASSSIMEPFVTIGTKPALPNSRSLSILAPLVGTDNGAGSTFTIGLPTVLPNSLVNFAAPSPIGSTTPAAITGTNVTAQTDLILGSSSDTAIARSAAGVAQINNGTTGNYGQLSVSSVATRVLSTPGTPTVAATGTNNSKAWGYEVAALDASGNVTTAASAQGTTSPAHGATTLTSGNFETITWSAVTGATSYKIYRTSIPSGGSPSTTGLIGTTTALTFNDTGIAATGSAPTVNTTGSIYPSGLGGTVGTPTNPFGSAYLGNGSNYAQLVPASLTGNRTCTIPDATSNPVQPLSGPTTGQAVGWVGSDGQQHLVSTGSTQMFPAESQAFPGTPWWSYIAYNGNSTFVNVGSGISETGTATGSIDSTGAWVNLATSASANSLADIADTTTGASPRPGMITTVVIQTGSSTDLANEALWVGNCQQVSGTIMNTSTPVWPTCAFRYFEGVDTNWQCVTVDNSSLQTTTDSGVTVSTGTNYTLTVDQSVSGQVTFWINGNLVATNSTHIPTFSTTSLTPCVQNISITGTATNVKIRSMMGIRQ
jgi:hypothetical protein